MKKTKYQQAQEYAEKQRLYASISGDGTSWLYTPKQFVNAFIDGYTAHEQSMWRSVEDGLPEDDETVLTYSSYGHVLAYYSEQDRMWFAYGNYGDINPTHWMPIPTIPDTNTEKK